MAVAMQYRTRLSKHLHKWNERRRNSIGRQKRQTLRIIKAGDYAQINAALGAWTRRKGYASLEDWARAAGDTSLAAQAEILQRQLYGNSAPEEIDRHVLAHGVENRISRKSTTKPPALVALNP
jgi:hypothetical protein